jgi:hypothetical protein
LCSACQENLEREATGSLLALYREIVSRYIEEVDHLAQAMAPASRESALVRGLLEECEKSRMMCMALLCELASRKGTRYSGRWRHFLESFE